MTQSEVKPWERFLEFLAESTRIFKGFSMALDAKKLVLALAGVVLWALGSMFVNTLAGYPKILIAVAGAVATVMLFFVFARSETETASKNFVLAFIGSLLAIWVIAGVLMVVAKNWWGLFGVVQLVWALGVASLFGTAVARIAALNATLDDTIGPRETARFALKKFTTSVWTLLIPVIAVLAYGLVLILLSILGRAPLVGNVWYVLIGVLYIIPLLVGLFFGAVILVYIPSLLLFQPAIAVEGNDSFDAISRSYSYVFGKPWRLAFYAMVSFIYARIILQVAALLVIGAGRITNWFIGRGIGPDMLDKAKALDLGAILATPANAPAAWNWTPAWNAVGHFVSRDWYKVFGEAGHAGGWFIVFWQHILLALYLAFAVSILYSLMTQIYLLMRKAVDGTPFEEVYIETSEEEAFESEFEGEAAPAEGEKTPEQPAEEASEKPKEKDKPIDLAGGEEDKDKK